MNELNKIIIASIALTTDGKIVYSKNEKNEVDILPIIYIGNYGIININQEIEYKRKMAFYFGSHSKGVNVDALAKGFFQGNEQSVADFGEISENIQYFQARKLKSSDKVSYVRIAEKKVVNNYIKIRYLVVPKNIDFNIFRDLECSKIEDLISEIKEGNLIPSDKLNFFLESEELQRLNEFSLLMESTTLDDIDNKKIK